MLRNNKLHKRSDEDIRKDAFEALARSPIIDGTEIEVTVDGGCIKLDGVVESRSAKHEAEVCVEHLTGVIAVVNQLRSGSLDP